MRLLAWLWLVTLSLALSACGTDYCSETCEHVRACGSEQATALFCDCEASDSYVGPAMKRDECRYECVFHNNDCSEIHNYAVNGGGLISECLFWCMMR